MIKTAVVLHIFYEDIAVDLIKTLTSVDADFDLVITTPMKLGDQLSALIAKCGRHVRLIECENLGQDVRPFLVTIPTLVENRYTAVCKLHTKQGRGALGEYWRRLACNAVLGQGALFKDIQRLFYEEKTLALLGSKELYMSAEAHMYGNHNNIRKIVRFAFPDRNLVPDWGFFAGSIFWLRPELFASLARAATEMRFESDSVQQDGQLAHAFERVFGLVPVFNAMNVGLVGADAPPEIEIMPAPGNPSRLATSQTLRRLATLSAQIADLKEIFRNENPLIHYIRQGESRGYKPNVIFDPAWYLEKNPDVRAAGISPLRHFVAYGAREMRNPGPDFDTQFYLTAHPDVQASGILPAVHYLRHGKAEGRLAKPDPDNLTTQVNGAGAEALPGSRERQIEGRAQQVSSMPRRTRVSVLVIGHWSEPGPLFGAERSLLDVARVLHEQGHLVHTVFPHENPEYFERVLDHVYSLSVFKYQWWKDSRPLDEQVVVRFMRLMRQHEIELVHVNTIMLREPLEAARRLNVARVVHTRELIRQDPDLIEYIGLDANEITEKVKEQTDYLIGNSQATLDSFEFSQDRNFRVYNGIDVDGLDLFNPVIPDEIRIGLISSNIPKKGLADFTRLAQLAQDQKLPLRFVLIGPINEHTRRLAKLAGLDRVPENLVVAGYASGPRAALEQVNIVLNLSHFAESFGRSVAEAMAARRPVIVYDHGALPELVRDGVDGYVIPYKQYERALDPLRRLCERPSRIIEMGEQARRRAVEEFSIDTMAEGLKVAYGRMTADILAGATKAGSLRIGYFMWHFPVPSETFVLNELRALTERGIDVKVFCRFSPHPGFVPDFPIEWQNVASPDELAQALQASGRTLVHAHFTYPTVTEYVWPVCEQIGLDFTFTAHAQDIFRYENDKKNRISEIARSPFCRKIFVLGGFHHAFLVERGVPPAKLMINPQMSDATLLARRPEAEAIGARFDRRRICAIQRLVDKKGIEFLVDAAPDLARLGVCVDIYGYGPLEQAIAESIARIGSDIIRLYGAVQGREQLLEVFGEHDLLIAPSVRAPDGDMDGIPTILMEAMGTGLPVLSSSIASVPDLVRDGVNGLLFEPGDPTAIVAAVERFYAMPGGRVRALAENARKTVQARYNPDRILANLLRQWRRESVDIVIVSWNNLPELTHVVDRLFKYTTLPFHLIICDNDSAADVVSYLDSLTAGHHNVNVIHNDYNSYVGPGTNAAIDAGSSRYAIYVCGKEGFALKFGWEIAMVDYMERHPGMGMAGSLGYSPRYFTGRQYIENHPMFGKFRNRGYAAEHPDRVFRHVQGGLFIIRRAMYEAIGGFSEAVPHAHTDTEYSYYAESCGWKLGAVPEIVSLYSATRPGLMTRIDENVLAVHPGSLATAELLDRVASGTVALCNLCGWHGESFLGADGTEACPQCSSGPGQRSVYRYLAESVLTHRQLAGLYLNPHPSLEPIWRRQFSGPILSCEEFDAAAGRDDPSLPDKGFDVIFDAGDRHREPVRLAHLGRLLKPGGVLLLDEAVGKNGVPMPEQAENLATAGLRIEERRRYASSVLRFSWQTLLVCARAES